jgi:hypothetical protein
MPTAQTSLGSGAEIGLDEAEDRANAAFDRYAEVVDELLAISATTLEAGPAASWIGFALRPLYTRQWLPDAVRVGADHSSDADFYSIPRSDAEMFNDCAGAGLP